MARVGFIGLGAMGSRIARTMLRAGHDVVVHDLNAAAMSALAEAGAQLAASPAALAPQVEVIHLSLPDSPQVLEVAVGSHGIRDGARPGLTIVDHSTVAPMTAQRLDAEFAPLGMRWLDAPVSGGPAGAEAGTLTIMVGGDRATFDRCLPVLETIGKKIEYMGASGTGAITKIVNQLAVGINSMAIFEALSLGVAAGIDARRIYEVLRTSSASCWVLEKLVPAVLLTNRQAEEPPAWFALRLQHKDVRIAVDTARALNVPLAAGALAEQLYAIAEGQGWGNQDQVAAVNLYAKYLGISKW